MPRVKDFTQSNKWKNLKKRVETRNEKELLDYIELLERQIVTLEAMINAFTMDTEDDKK